MGGQEFSQAAGLMHVPKPICPPRVKVLVNIQREIKWRDNNKSARTTGTFIFRQFTLAGQSLSDTKERVQAF